MRIVASVVIGLSVVIGGTTRGFADEAADGKQLAADKAALKSLQIFVGGWKGVGQPRRGSTRGSWIAESAWAWKFDKDRAALVFEAAKQKFKFFSAGRLEPGDKAGQFRFIGTLPDGKETLTYTGEVDKDERLILTADETTDEPPTGYPARISLRTVAKGDRLLVLYERRLGDSQRYLRLAEVGYTRKGSGFGQGVVMRECIITGGAGTIAVSFKGQTYYVCCTGCRDLFEEDPAAAIAEYKERKAAEKKKR